MSRENDVSLDLGCVTHTCVCGCDTWKILVTFDEYEIATYSLDMYCFNCNSKARAPTALDNPEDPDYCEE